MSAQRAELVAQIPQTEIFPFHIPDAENLTYLASRIFSCWHLRLGRPITRGRESYRACLWCGMHRAFDPESWTTTGPFYSPRVDKNVYQ